MFLSHNDVLILIGSFFFGFLFLMYRNRHNFTKPKTKAIYVAGSWNYRHDLQIKMNELRAKGYIVTSYWLTFEDKNNNPIDYAECA